MVKIGSSVENQKTSNIYYLNGMDIYDSVEIYILLNNAGIAHPVVPVSSTMSKIIITAKDKILELVLLVCVVCFDRCK